MMNRQISSFGVDYDKDTKAYYIFAENHFGRRVFFTEDGEWTYDKSSKAESDDFDFVFDEMKNLLSTDAEKDECEIKFFFG